jgi:RimJ/RimL family protein N-acetyltransferase
VSDPSIPEPSVAPVALRIGPYLLDVARPTDLDAVVAAFADPDIARWNPGTHRPGVPDRDRAQLWIADRTTWAPDHASWVIRDVDGTVIGQVSLHHVSQESGSAEIGYWLAPAGRGRGIGAAAVATATDYAFDVLGIVRIELFHAVENEASCRLARRTGYVLEGVARQSYVYGDGLRHDEHMHARLIGDPAPDVVVPAAPGAPGPSAPTR